MHKACPGTATALPTHGLTASPSLHRLPRTLVTAFAMFLVSVFNFPLEPSGYSAAGCALGRGALDCQCPS
jgi:hypothetical protein